MRILLAGGAGFLGSHLSDKLLALGHNVVCIDSLITGNLENIKHRKEEEFYDKFFTSIFLFEHNSKSAKKSSQIFWKLRKDGTAIGRFDSIIAGILLSNGVKKILTRNVKHFEKIKELEIIDY